MRALLVVNKTLAVFGLFYLVFLTLWVLHSLKLDAGFPKGYDTVGHVSQVEFVRRNFPNIFWNPYWYMGSVAFPSGYPPLYHNGLGLVAKIFQVSPSDLVRDTANFSMILVLVSFFGIAYLVSGSLLVALSVPFLAMATPAFWTFILQFGLHIRIFGMALYSLHLLVLLAYLKSKNYQILYPFVVATLTAVILTHLFIGALAFLAFTFFIFNFGERGTRLITWFKTLLISFGLAAFYYIPYLVIRPVGIPLINGSTTDPVYDPIKFELLYKWGYPGLGILPVLALVMLVIVKIVGRIRQQGTVNYGASKQLVRSFYFFLVLGCAFIIYGLGTFKFYFLGVYRSHAPFFVAVFLIFALIFALAYVGKKIVLEVFLAVAVLVLTRQALTMSQALKDEIATNSISSIIDNLSVAAIDEGKNYRFSNYFEHISAAFNIKYDGLQTRGYFSQAIIYPRFNWLFEMTVFGKENSLAPKFFFDWYAIDQIYLGSRIKASVRNSYAADKENFTRVGDYFFYRDKTPIFLATDAPYVYVSVDDLGYVELIRQVAQIGWGPDAVIPLFGSGGRKNRELTVADFADLAKLLPPDQNKTYATSGRDLLATYINTGHWEVVLDKQFKGLVFKQSFFDNWHAKIVDDAGKSKKLKILMAGPGVMYVILPDQFRPPARVIFEYKHSWSEYLGAVVSVGTLIWVIWRVRFKRKLLLPQSP